MQNKVYKTIYMTIVIGDDTYNINLPILFEPNRDDIITALKQSLDNFIKFSLK